MPDFQQWIKEIRALHSVANDRLSTAHTVLTEVVRPSRGLARSDQHVSTAMRDVVDGLVRVAIAQTETLDHVQQQLSELISHVGAQTAPEPLSIVPPTGTPMEDVPLHMLRAIESQIDTQLRSKVSVADREEVKVRITAAIAVTTLRFLVAADSQAPRAAANELASKIVGELP